MKTKRFWVALLLAVGTGPGCRKAEGAVCFDLSACDEGLACVGEAVKRCEKCDDLDQCTENGKCTAKDGVCQAASDEDCKKSYGCKARGPCTAKDGQCVVGSDADCQQSEACAKDKYCIAKGNNCVMSEADKKAKLEADKAATKAAGDG